MLSYVEDTSLRTLSFDIVLHPAFLYNIKINKKYFVKCIKYARVMHTVHPFNNFLSFVISLFITILINFAL